jgi:hypothetical protein
MGYHEGWGVTAMDTHPPCPWGSTSRRSGGCASACARRCPPDGRAAMTEAPSPWGLGAQTPCLAAPGASLRPPHLRRITMTERPVLEPRLQEMEQRITLVERRLDRAVNLMLDIRVLPALATARRRGRTSVGAAASALGPGAPDPGRAALGGGPRAAAAGPGAGGGGPARGPAAAGPAGGGAVMDLNAPVPWGIVLVFLVVVAVSVGVPLGWEW